MTGTESTTENLGQTSQIIANKNLMNGAATGVPFTASNQPDPALKKKGWAKRRALNNLLKIKNPGRLGTNQTDYAQLASDFYGIPKEEITIEVIMHFRQIERAILKADTYAYEAVQKRAYGNPTQPLTGANGKDLIPPEHKVIHVHSDIPLSQSEDEVQL
jgi:hypothetical protein